MSNIYLLLDQFRDYYFDENLHKYSYLGQPVKTSVTQFIESFYQPFDKDYWSRRKAVQRGITQEEILAEWQRKADISARTGTQFHSFMENSLASKNTPKHHFPEDQQEEIFTRYELLKPLGQKFLFDSRNTLVPIKSEIVIGYEDKIAGQIDQLFYNKSSQELEVWDWKTNKEILTQNKYRKKMLNEFSFLDDCNYNHYSLQLNIYKNILIRYGFNIGRCYFVWFNENNDNYQCFECLDLQSQVQTILNRL